MKHLPKKILNALINDKTSLGDHPGFPPDDESKFIVKLVDAYYSEIAKGFENSKNGELSKKLAKYLTIAQKIEQNNIEALETICKNILTEMFDIPDDTISMSMNLVTNISIGKQRDWPEKTDDFSFEDMNEIKYLTKEVYKRRLVDALVSGASIWMAEQVDEYEEDINRVEPHLFDLYSMIWRMNDYLRFSSDSFEKEDAEEAGDVSVKIPMPPERPIIKAEGSILPVLIEESIKGVLELAASHGLPEDRRQAEYITKKADFRMAEDWDTIIGTPLWILIDRCITDAGFNSREVGVNYIIMEIAKLSTENDEFNMVMQNAFKHTKTGVEMMGSICHKIITNRKRDEFDNFIKTQSDRHQIDDQVYYDDENVDGLLIDSE